MKGKRRTILETAEHDFLEKGYDGTSIDAIVREVGGSKSTVYAHFRDKRVLFAAALADVQNEFDFSLRRAGEQEAVNLHQRLTLMGVELLTLLFSTRAVHLFRTLVAESRRFPEVGRQFINEGLDVAKTALAQPLEEARSSGRLPRNLDALGAADELVSLLTGNLYLKLLLDLIPPPSSAEISERADHLTERFLTPLGQQPIM